MWDELWRKIRDLGASFPSGVGELVISEGFGGVFGFQLAVTGDSFSDAEQEGLFSFKFSKTGKQPRFKMLDSTNGS